MWLRLLLLKALVQMNKKLLDKFLNHQASIQDIEALKSDPETAEFISLSEQATDLKYEGFQEQQNWRAINNHISGISKQPINSQNKNLLVRLIKLNPTPQVFLRVAALLIMALGTYFFLSPNNTTLITPEGIHQSWTLPDGSEISLNAESKANYDPESWNNDRVIELEGEAFFDVRKGSTFSVKTNSGVVTVLGTEFNIKVRDHQFFVHCFEGLVKVQTQDTTLMLPAGSGMKLDHGLLSQELVSIGAKPDWIHGESSFNNTPLLEVLHEIGRQYAISIRYNPEFSSLIETSMFSGSFTHIDLNIALKSVCQPYDLNFERSENEVRIFRD